MSHNARDRPRGDEMKCTVCERWTVVRLRPSEKFFAMLNEALVVNLLHVRVLEWSKNHGGKTEDLSTAAHRRFYTEGRTSKLR